MVVQCTCDILWPILIILRAQYITKNGCWCQLLMIIFKKMNREIMEITELALANILDVIPLISNTGEMVDPIILRIYERNAAVLEQN